MNILRVIDDDCRQCMQAAAAAYPLPCCGGAAGSRDRAACGRPEKTVREPDWLGPDRPVVSPPQSSRAGPSSRDPMRGMWGRASSWMWWGRPGRGATWAFMYALRGRWSQVPVSGGPGSPGPCTVSIKASSHGSTEFAARKEMLSGSWSVGGSIRAPPLYHARCNTSGRDGRRGASHTAGRRPFR